jgi:dipeptidyl aminopeptidase/acylaminoacyl peptidase
MSEYADRMLAEWLREGPDRGPTEGLRRALAATHRTPQRPGWTIPERWLPMQLAMRPALNPRPFLLVLMAALLAIVAVGALMLAGSPRRPAPTAGLAGNGAILVNVGAELWLADADGSHARRLDIGLGASSSPAFSPDGTRFAFKTRDPGRPWSLFVANADGSNAHSVSGDLRIVALEMDAITWSPDGSALAFTSSDAGTDRIYRVDLDGGAPVALTDKSANRAWPSWSPNGAWLAYKSSPASGGQSLMISQPDGSGTRALASAQGENASFSAPKWAADSRRLVYVRSEGDSHVIASVDLDGRETIVSLPGESAFEPSWSPDGARLAYGTSDGGVVVDVNNLSKRIAIPKAISDCWMAWSPDASVLLGADEGCTGIYSIPLEDPRAATRIQLPQGQIGIAAWQRIAPYSGSER